MKHKIIIALGMLIITGCVSTENNNVYKTENHIKGKNDIYATLKKDKNNNFSFDKFSFFSIPNSINLNTLVHNYPTKESECKNSIGSRWESGLCAEDALFSTSTIDGGDIVKNTVGNLFATIAILNPRIIEPGVFYTARFDYVSYKKALDEALSKLDRNALILEANAIFSKHQDTLTKASFTFNDFKLKINKLVNKSVKVFDDSHLYSSQPQVETIVSRKFIGNLILKDLWATTEELNDKLNNQVKTSAQYGEIGLRCKGLSDFSFKIVGCQQSWKYSSDLIIEPITYSISSAKKYTFYPIIKAIDENLTISSTKTGQIEIINKTNSFITLSSLSFYLGNNIETLSNLNLELAPRAVSNNLNMNKFKAYSSNRTLRSIIKKDLNNKIAIGVATKYKIIDTNVEKTIYKKSNYKYSELGGYIG
jgi:hypothetical protein